LHNPTAFLFSLALVELAYLSVLFVQGVKRLNQKEKAIAFSF
jgi:hypothetical protein